MTYQNDNRFTQRFAVLDIETLNRVEAYEVYARLDKDDAAPLRYPFRSTVAAALLTFSVTDGLFEFGHLDCWAGDDEPALLKALFDRLHMLPDYRLVTYGGLWMDLPVLRIGAARHHLRLPCQLIANARQNRDWLHLDLAKEYQAGRHIHMSEVAVALDLPVKFADRASQVPLLMKGGKLERLKNIPVADVLTLSLILQAELETHGELISARAAQITTLQEVRRRRPEARFADYLGRVEQRLSREVMAEAQKFVASAA